MTAIGESGRSTQVARNSALVMSSNRAKATVGLESP
jgi:hypothetical protein